MIFANNVRDLSMANSCGLLSRHRLLSSCPITDYADDCGRPAGIRSRRRPADGEEVDVHWIRGTGRFSGGICGGFASEDYVLMLNMHRVREWLVVRHSAPRNRGALREPTEQEDPRFARLPVQYADFAGWQREWLHGDALEQQFAYWHERLGEQAPC